MVLFIKVPIQTVLIYQTHIMCAITNITHNANNASTGHSFFAVFFYTDCLLFQHKIFKFIHRSYL